MNSEFVIEAFKSNVQPNVSLLDDEILPTTVTFPKVSFPTQPSKITLYSPVGKTVKSESVALPVRFLILRPCTKIEIKEIKEFSIKTNLHCKDTREITAERCP